VPRSRWPERLPDPTKSLLTRSRPCDSSSEGVEPGGKPKTRRPTPSLFIRRVSVVLAKPPNSLSKGQICTE
jgi:hypothetical protein